MTAKDKWGYTTIYSGGQTVEERRPGKGYIAHFYYSENDGWSFIRGGADRSLHIEFGRDVRCKDLGELVNDPSMNSDVRMLIKDMVKGGKLMPGRYPVD